MPINVGDLVVTLRGDDAQLQSVLTRNTQSATNFKNAATQLGIETDNVSQSFGGLVREGTSAERALIRTESAMQAIAATGNITSGSMSQLAFGMSRLAPTLLPIVGIGVTLVEVWKRWQDANTEAQKAADEAADRWSSAMQKMFDAAKNHPQLAKERAEAELAAANATLASADATQELVTQMAAGAAKDAAQTKLDADVTEATRARTAALRILAGAMAGFGDENRKIAESADNIENRLRREFDLLFATGTQAADWALEYELAEKKITGARADAIRATQQQIDAEKQLREIMTLPLESAGGALTRAAGRVGANPLQGAQDQVAQAMQRMTEGDFQKNQQELARETERNNTIMIRSFESLGQAMGKIAVTGGNAWKALTSGLLAMGADVAKNLGATLIKAGVTAQGFGALGQALKSFALNPLASIAIGVALVALGSAMGAAESGIASNAASGGGSAAVASASQPQGNLTFVFPKDALIDPGSIAFQDAIASAFGQAQGRNVRFQSGG